MKTVLLSEISSEDVGKFPLKLWKRPIDSDRTCLFMFDVVGIMKSFDDEEVGFFICLRHMI